MRIKNILLLTVLILITFLNFNLILANGTCSGGYCPYNPSGGGGQDSSSSSSNSGSTSSQPHSSSSSSSAGSSSSSSENGNYCPSDYCSHSLADGRCPGPCKDKDTGNMRYCCCIKESLEELDERLESNQLLKTDEPIGFIQRCICKEFSHSCNDDTECMSCPVDPYEKELYPKVCGNGVLYPPSSTPPTPPLITSNTPKIHSYTFETGILNFFKNFVSQGLSFQGSTIYFDQNVSPFSLITYFVLNLALRLSGIILFIILVYSGIMYSLSGGDPKKKQEAQKRIIEAIIGFFLLFGFYIILNTINPNILKRKETEIPSKINVVQLNKNLFKNKNL